MCDTLSSHPEYPDAPGYYVEYQKQYSLIHHLDDYIDKTQTLTITNPAQVALLLFSTLKSANRFYYKFYNNEERPENGTIRDDIKSLTEEIGVYFPKISQQISDLIFDLVQPNKAKEWQDIMRTPAAITSVQQIQLFCTECQKLYPKEAKNLLASINLISSQLSMNQRLGQAL